VPSSVYGRAPGRMRSRKVTAIMNIYVSEREKYKQTYKFSEADQYG